MRDLQPAVVIAVMVADNCLLRKDALFVSNVLIYGADKMRDRLGNNLFSRRMTSVVFHINQRRNHIDDFLEHDTDFEESVIESYKRKF